MRGILVSLLLGLFFLGCARHHVIDRHQGRVDGDRSIASTSDVDWTVQSEPDSDTQR